MSADAPQALKQARSHRDRGDTMGPLFGLAAGPAGWVIQLVVGYGVSSYACFPHDAPARQSPPPGWAGEPALLLAINIACLLLVLAGLVVSLSAWRRSQNKTPTGAAAASEVREGRTRFLAGCGVLANLGFAVAILFDTVSILGTPACWSIAP